jgi:16S rRNA (guanine527-N7)-methyltransferase
MEKISQNSAAAGGFDLIVFRAFKPLEVPVLKNLLSLAAPGGALAAYKGRRESIMKELTQSVKTLEESAELSWKILPLEVPFLNEERHLLVINAAPCVTL